MPILFKPQAPSLKFAKHVHDTGVIHQFCIYAEAQFKNKNSHWLLSLKFCAASLFFFIILTNTIRKFFIAVVIIFVVWRHIQHSQHCIWECFGQRTNRGWGRRRTRRGSRWGTVLPQISLQVFGCFLVGTSVIL